MITQLRDAEIAKAVRLVYGLAGIAVEDCVPHIAPLSTFIEAYPIRSTEIPNLTYESAVHFLARETGQTMPSPPIQGKLAGFLYVYEYRGYFYGCILVEANDSIARRRFSAAHELGHYLLHFLPLLKRGHRLSSEALVLTEGLNYNADLEGEDDIPFGELQVAHDSSSDQQEISINIQQMEREANQFAAELLIPALSCRALVEEFSPRFSKRLRVLTRRLATEFLVSPEAMKWRLTGLGLLENSVVETHGD
jgi:hypothetical protein